MKSNKPKTVLVTGCSTGGAGNALAVEFARRGYKVFATARSLASLRTLQDKNIETLVLDVTSPSSIAALKDLIIQRTGGYLDILFNNAGTMYEAPAVEADSQRVRAMFDANVFGMFDMITAFTPLLLKAVGNHASPPTIVNVASILARLPYPFASAYNASKAAVASYSDTLRLEVKPLGLNVVTVYMGEVSTSLMSADNISFGSESLYVDLEGTVKTRSSTHAEKSMKPKHYAHQVVEAITGGKNHHVWKGSNAFAVWLMDAVAPRALFDGMMEGPVGLKDSTQISKIFDRGQRVGK